MASAFVVPYRTRRGLQRFRVRYRLGGRETPPLHGGSFRTKREANLRRDWIAVELAALRVPDLSLVVEKRAVESVRSVAERWRSSRVDVSAGTDTSYGVRLVRIVDSLGDREIDDVSPSDVAAFAASLAEDGLKRETIRKIVGTLGMVLEFAGVQPNPARDRLVKLPRDDRVEVNPPTAAHFLEVHRLVPASYRLPLVVLDATGMRVGELEALTWGDVDEIEGRWRVSASVAKTRRARWVPVEPTVFQAVVATVPREDRDLDARVFADFGADRLRTALTRACKASAVPAFSPHDLRHRRATLWHLGGVPAAQAAAWLGHSAQEHLRTYAHASLSDRSELDYEGMLTDDRAVVLR